MHTGGFIVKRQHLFSGSSKNCGVFISGIMDTKIVQKR